MIKAVLEELKRQPLAGTASVCALIAFFGGPFVAPQMASAVADSSTMFLQFVSISTAVVVGAALLSTLLWRAGALVAIVMSVLLWVLSIATLAATALKYLDNGVIGFPGLWDGSNFWRFCAMTITGVFVGLTMQLALNDLIESHNQRIKNNRNSAVESQVGSLVLGGAVLWFIGSVAALEIMEGVHQLVD